MVKKLRFKVGDRVRLRAVDLADSMGHLIGNTYEIIKVDKGTLFPYKLYDPDSDHYWWVRENQVEPVAKTLDTLEVGDVLIDEDGDEITVLAIVERLVFVSILNAPAETVGYYTVHDLKEEGYTVKGAEEEVEELTVAEVEKRLGRKIKIVDKESS